MDEQLKKKLNTLSPQQLKALIEKLGKKKKELPKMPINADNEYPLTSAQKRMWFLAKLNPESFLYTNPMAVRLTTSTPLELKLYTESFKLITARHEIMRTSFGSENGEVFQVIHNEVPFQIDYKDLRSCNADEQKILVEEILSTDGQTTIDVEAFPLFRHSILQLSESEYVFIYTSHHIISDAWSSATLFRQVLQVYDELKNAKTVQLAPPKYRFVDYVNWENNWLKSPEYNKSLAEWKKMIPRNPEPLNLPFDYVRPAIINYEGALQKLILNAELVKKITEFSRQENVNIFHTLLATFNILLYKYSGNDDIVVGIPLANRNLKEFQETIGLFLNTLPHKTTIDENSTFRQYLTQVKNVSQQVLLHQELPFEKLIEELQPERNRAISPVFQVLFVYQNIPSLYEWGGLKLSPEKADYKISKYALNLWLEDVADELYLSLSYQTSLFKPATIKRFLKQYEFLLNEIVRNSEKKITELDAEHKKTTTHSFAKNIENTWVSEFEKQVAIHPDKPAVKYKATVVTYNQLNTKANQIANYLNVTKKENHSVIAMMLDRSEALITAILGINKSGAAYLPIDPAQPQQRIDFILQDAGIKYVITEEKYASRFQQHDIQLLLLDTHSKEIEQQNTANPSIHVSSNNLAYIIYTSGSTGNPKGVCIEHRQLFNYSTSVWKRIDLDTDSVFANVSSIATDLGNTQIFPALIHGATVDIIAEELITNALQLAAYTSKNQLDCLKITPSLLAGLLNVSGTEEILPHKLLILGGEKIQVELIEKIRNINKQLRILNHYGPTETTIGVLTHEIGEVQSNSIVPLGTALDNNIVFIADKNNREVADGMPGEIIVCGNNVARGYNNNEALTKNAFIESADFIGYRCYKTGDKGRKLQDGTIAYLGRIDRQLKIRGYRVEPEGIEKVILKNKSVAQAVVISPEENVLTAFITATEGQQPNIEQLKQELKSALPNYMLPANIVLLNSLPRLGNGKLDMQALGGIKAETILESAHTTVAPRDETELALLHIWKEVTKNSTISITDNFFDVGGNSLMAIELIGKINNRFASNLSISVLFEHNSIGSIARLIRSKNAVVPVSNSLVLLKKGSSETTIFFVHPAGGDILCYYDLAQCIADTTTVYGIQSSIAVNDSSIKAMATHYLEALKNKGLAGNFIFAGWSMGALVAYEMAVQLQQSENKTSQVIILDQKAPEYKLNPTTTLITPIERLAVFAGKVEQLVGAPMYINKEVLQQLNAVEQSDLFLKQFKKHNIVPEDIETKDFHGFLEKMILHNEITIDYKAEKYNGSVLLVKADDSTVASKNDNQHYNWNYYSTNMKSANVPGTHITMMKMPNVKQVADVINATIS